MSELLGLLAGLVAMAAGALLASSPSPVAAGVTANGYQVGNLVLPAQAPGVYSGGAVVIISTPSRGITLSAADGSLGSTAFSGFCTTTRTSEKCSFVLGHTTYGARDRLVQRGGMEEWLRTYSDGVRTAIPTLGGAAPVPLPLGLP